MRLWNVGHVLYKTGNVSQKWITVYTWIYLHSHVAVFTDNNLADKAIYTAYTVNVVVSVYLANILDYRPITSHI